MPLRELKNLNLNKLLPMFPDRSVTHVPGLDRYRAVTVRERSAAAFFHSLIHACMRYYQRRHECLLHR